MLALLCLCRASTGCAVVSKDCRHGCTCPGLDGAVLTLELDEFPSSWPFGCFWEVLKCRIDWSSLKPWLIFKPDELVIKLSLLLSFGFIFTAWFLLPAAAVNWSWKGARRHMGLGSHLGLPCRHPWWGPSVYEKGANAYRSSSRKLLLFHLPSWELRNVLQNQSHYPHCFLHRSINRFGFPKWCSG